MTQQNIINDLSSYTKVPVKVFKELIVDMDLCIGSAIHDAILQKEEAAVLDIGIGTLSVDLIGMQCKFIPSKNLKSIIKKSISEKIDRIEKTVEQALINKLLAICEGNNYYGRTEERRNSFCSSDRRQLL